MAGPPTEVSFHNLRSWFRLYPKGLAVLYGHPTVNSLAQRLLAMPLVREERVVVLDAGNLFDPYLFTFMAQSAGKEPREFLRKIIISRSFTCHQTYALVHRAARLDPNFSRSILILGLLNTFYDEEVPEDERRALLKRTVALLKRISEAGNQVLVTSTPPPLPARGGFSAILFDAADVTVTLEAKPDGSFSLHRLVPARDTGRPRI